MSLPSRIDLRARRLAAVGALLWALTGAAGAAPGSGLRSGPLPLVFQANDGQAPPAIAFLARGAGYDAYLEATAAVFVLARPEPDRVAHSARAAGAPAAWPSPEPPLVVRMQLIDASPSARLAGLEPLAGRVNYLLGNDPTRWHTNVKTYAEVRCHDVYPGIDIVYRGGSGTLAYDFVVAAGADARRIALAFDGIDRLEVDADGQLLLHVDGGTIRHRIPAIYETVNGVPREIEGRYVAAGRNRVEFATTRRDTTRPLVIDPVVSYSTYLGGPSMEQVQGMAIDKQGNAYVAGHTWSAVLPTTAGAWQREFAGGGISGGGDAFVAKLDATGSAFVYLTYLGGTSRDDGNAIAVDADGNALLAGLTQSADFPTTPGALMIKSDETSPDAFVLKLDPTGAALVFSTYIGGNGYDAAQAVAVDANGNAYAAGVTTSTNWPASATAFQTRGGPDANAFVAKLDRRGAALVYSTYLGGTGRDGANALALDEFGNAWITGDTSSPDFPTSTTALQSTLADTSDYGADAFVAKLDTTGSALLYSSYFGGSALDTGADVAVDREGSVYVVGGTRSADFPTTEGALQRTLRGGADAFVAKIDTREPTLAFSTYLGGLAYDSAHGIAVDSSGEAYVTGTTSSRDFPRTNDTFQRAAGTPGDVTSGHFDAFVAAVSSGGTSLRYSSYLGGSGNDEFSGDDYGLAIALHDDGAVYVAGLTSSLDFPTTSSAAQTTNSGLYDVFIVKLVDERANAATAAAQR